ncbi:MAG: hypothetical protein MRY64_14285 [Hyphomonadaceae bacterium]|nr:hypothetical protein [Hyphomonadaceae bacterium]
MASLNANLRSAKRDFFELLEVAEDFFMGLSTAEQILGGCLACLVLMWLFVRRSDDGDDTPGMVRQFAFALVLVVIFSSGVGFIFGPNVASLTDSLF